MKTEVARAIFVDNVNSIDFSQVGAHWTSDEKTLATVKSSLVGNKNGKKYILYTTISNNDIDAECTEISNTNYPHEKEVVLNLNTNINVEVYDPSEDEVVISCEANTGNNCNEWVNKIHRGENID